MKKKKKKIPREAQASRSSKGDPASQIFFDIIKIKSSTGAVSLGKAGPMEWFFFLLFSPFLSPPPAALSLLSLITMFSCIFFFLALSS